MSRKGPKPRMRPDGYWYCTLTIEGRKRQYGLGVRGEAKEAQAWEAFSKLLERLQNHPDRSKPLSRKGTIGEVCESYLNHLRRHNSERRLEDAKPIIERFSEVYGSVPVGNLDRKQIEDWLYQQAHSHYANSTLYLIGSTIRAALRHGADYLGYPQPPKIKLKKVTRRERYLTEEQSKKVLEAAAPDFRDFLFVCMKTGARPLSEVASVSISDPDRYCDLHQGVWSFAKHKTSGKGQQRTVYLRKDVLELCERYAKKYPTGPLLRTSRGKPWHKHVVLQRWTRLRKKLGLDASYTFYCATRHSFASQLLNKNYTLAQVSKLMGNSIEVCMRHYAHLEKANLRDVLEAL